MRRNENMPDDRCSVCCSSWRPKSSAPHWALDDLLPQVCLTNPPLKPSGSGWSTRWRGTLTCGPRSCYGYHSWGSKHEQSQESLWNIYIITKLRCRCKTEMWVFPYILKVWTEFSIQAVCAGIWRTVFPKTWPCATEVLLLMFSTRRRISSDITAGHVLWFFLFDRSGTHILRRQDNKKTQVICITRIT